MESTIKNSLSYITSKDNGEKTRVIHVSPMFREQANHEKTEYTWVGIDTNIAPDGTTPGVPFDVLFKQFINEQEAIQVYGKPGIAKFSLKKFGLSGYEEDAISGEVQFDGNTATYILPWGKVIYTVSTIGIKEDIIIEEDLLDDPVDNGISLEGLTVVIDLGFSPVPFEGKLFAYDSKGADIQVVRTDNGIAIPYEEYSSAVFPLVVDPTINVESDATGWVSSASSSATPYRALYDDKQGMERRAVAIIPIDSEFDHSTVYGAVFQHYLYAYTERNDYKLFCLATYATNITYSLFSASASLVQDVTNHAQNSYSNIPVFDQVLEAIKLEKGGVCFRTETPRLGGYYVSVDFHPAGHSTYPPRLSIDYYDSFTQNTPTPSGTDAVEVSWEYGTGTNRLTNVADRRRVYYKQGSGHTAQEAIDDNNYVDSDNNTSTSATVSGLASGDVYSFVVVDMQDVGGTLYPGARSEVQTATTASGNIPVTGVSLNHDTMELTLGGAPGLLIATVLPPDATNPDVWWGLEGESVTTSEGATQYERIITPVAVGVSMVGVLAEDTSVGLPMAYCTVTVVEAAEPEPPAEPESDTEKLLGLLMVEGTTNLVTEASSNFLNGEQTAASTWDITFGHSIPGITVDKATRVKSVSNSGTYRVRLALSTFGGNATVSFWIYNQGQNAARITFTRLYVSGSTAGAITIQPGELRCIVITGGLVSGEDKYLSVVTSSPYSEPDIVCYQLQTEQTPYPTPWHPGGQTRANPKAEIILPKPLPQEFGIGVWFKPLWDSETFDLEPYRTVLSVGSSISTNIVRVMRHTNNNWDMRIFADGVGGTALFTNEFSSGDKIGFYFVKELSRFKAYIFHGNTVFESNWINVGGVIDSTLIALGSHLSSSIRFAGGILSNFTLHTTPADIDPTGFLSSPPGGVA